MNIHPAIGSKKVTYYSIWDGEDPDVYEPEQTIVSDLFDYFYI